MKHRVYAVTCYAFLSLLLFIGPSFAARSNRTVSSAKELQKALDDGVTDIRISSSITGNFIVPRWVYSISGTSQSVTLTPADESKPVFDAESSTKKNLVRAAEVIIFWPAAAGHALMSEATAETLEFSNMTILCGRYSGLNADSISKPVTVRNVTFRGVRPQSSDKNFAGCYPSTETKFENCTFNGLTWCIDTQSVSSYNLNIRNCTFSNSSQALSVSKSGSSARAYISDCKGDVGWWAILHEPGSSTMLVNINQRTIDSNAGSDFYHKIVDTLGDSSSYNDLQFQTYREDLERRFASLPSEARKLISGERRGWDAIRLFATGELQKALQEIDFQDSSVTPRELKERIDHCVSLYALLAAAPVTGILTSDGTGFKVHPYSLCAEVLGGFVRDKNLITPIIRSFFGGRDLEALSRTSDRISWGNTGNVRDAFASPQKIDSTPDRLFRENIHRLQDWLFALNTVRGDMKKVQDAAVHALSSDFSYVAELEKRLRNIYDLGIASNRVIAAILFDLPMDTVFATNFARVMGETAPNRIVGICRELGPFYSVSQRLCVLNRTNSLRTELMKTWKEKLVESHLFGSDDHSRYNELVAYLSTDSDLMRDATRLDDFFREWR